MIGVLYAATLFKILHIDLWWDLFALNIAFMFVKLKLLWPLISIYFWRDVKLVFNMPRIKLDSMLSIFMWRHTINVLIIVQSWLDDLENTYVNFDRTTTYVNLLTATNPSRWWMRLLFAYSDLYLIPLPILNLEIYWHGSLKKTKSLYVSLCLSIVLNACSLCLFRSGWEVHEQYKIVYW